MAGGLRKPVSKNSMEKLSRFADLNVLSGPVWPGVTYFSSTRQGGVSEGPWNSLNLGLHTEDDPAHVAENRRRLTDSMPAPVLWLQQVHGTEVVDADHCVRDSQGLADVQADALITARREHVLAILTADCLPVVLGSSDGRVIGVAHAGWRGLAAGILENTLIALKKKHDTQQDVQNDTQQDVQWRAWIGPGVGQASFEVGDEVRYAFVSYSPSVACCFVPSGQQGKWLADLSAIARHRLAVRGVTQIDASPFCTSDRQDLFYSYRCEKQTGRFATFAWRTACE